MEQLYNKKREMKKAWENCFECEMEDKLTRKGVQKFWADDTSETEAFDLLSAAGASLCLNDRLGLGIDIDKIKGIKFHETGDDEITVIGIELKHD